MVSRRDRSECGRGARGARTGIHPDRGRVGTGRRTVARRGSRRDRARCSRRARLRRDRRGDRSRRRARRVRRLLDGRAALPAARARSSRPGRTTRARERVARHRRRDRARRAAATTRSSRATSSTGASSRSCAIGSRNRSSPRSIRTRPGSPIAPRGTPPPTWPRPCAGSVPARRNRCGSRLGELRMPVALVTGRADAKFEQINDAMQAACAPPTSCACTSTAVTPCRSSSPKRWPSFLLDWLAAAH